MKKCTFTLFILIISLAGKSQTSVNIFIKDYCNDSIKVLDCELIDKAGNYYKRNTKTGYFELKIDTSYFFSANIKRNGISYLINQTFNVNSNDTLNEYFHFYRLMDGWINNFYDQRFYLCKELCDGIVEDYYEDGTIRIKGEYRQGIPVGKIAHYNKKGEITKIEKYNKKGTLKKTKKY